jgi:hypothetical protein
MLFASCGKESETKTDNDQKSVVKSMSADKTDNKEDEEYRTDITWDNLEESIVNIRYFIYDADLQIKFEKNNVLYSKSQLDKKFLYKGYWKIEKDNELVTLDIKDIGNKSSSFLMGDFKSFCVINSKIGSIHSIIFHRSATFPKQKDFDGYLDNSDYLILFADAKFKENLN